MRIIFLLLIVLFGLIKISEAQPQFVKNIVTKYGSEISYATNIGDKVFFLTGSYNTAPNALWITDGTDPGTKALTPATIYLSNANPQVINDIIYFFGRTENTDIYDLWRSDGTEAGTYIVKKSVSYPEKPNYFSLKEAAVLNGKLFFIANSAESKKQLWQSDGTEHGTVVVKGDFENNQSNALTNLISFRNELYFFYSNSKTKTKELWKTDGTYQQTQRSELNDLLENFSAIEQDAILNDDLYFYAASKDKVIGLWRTDGSIAGTYFVKKLSAFKIYNSTFYPFYFKKWENNLYFFTADSTYSINLYKTDGTTVGTQYLKSVTDANYSGSLTPLTLFANKGLVFSAKNNLYNSDIYNGNEIWLSDGTSEGTKIIKDIRKGFASSVLYNTNIIEAGSYIYFTANDGIYGNELWQSDGTEINTRITHDFIPGVRSSNPKPIISNNGTLYFSVFTNNQQQLWKIEADKHDKLPLPPKPAKAVEWYKTIASIESGGSSGYSTYNNSLVVDKNDNIYIAGKYGNDKLVFYDDDYIMPSFKLPGNYYPNQRSFIAKYNTDGKLLWSKNIAGESAEFANEISLLTDKDNNLYVGGAFPKYAVFDSIKKETPAGTPYLAKYDTDGKLIWLKTGNAMQGVYVNKIKSDVEDNIYMAGRYHGFRANWDNHFLRGDTSPTNYIVKYNKNGEVLWARNIYVNWKSYGKVADIATDKSGKVYVLITQGTRNTWSSCKYQNWIIKVVCIDGKSGVTTWEKTFEGDDFSIATSIQISPLNELFITGTFRGNISFDNFTLTSPAGTRGECNKNASFLVRMNINGEVRNAITDNGVETDPYQLLFNEDGSYYLTGIESYDDEMLEGYQNYNYEFPRGRKRTFIRRYDYQSNLLEERIFRRNGDKNTSGYELNPMIALDSKKDIILLEAKRAQYDTIGQSRLDLMNGQVHLLKIKNNLPGKLTTPYNNDLTISPNPASDYIYIRSTDSELKQYNIEIVNYLGQPVANASKKDNLDFYTLNVSYLRPGFYFIIISNGEKRISKKFIKL